MCEVQIRWPAEKDCPPAPDLRSGLPITRRGAQIAGNGIPQVGSKGSKKGECGQAGQKLAESYFCHAVATLSLVNSMACTGHLRGSSRGSSHRQWQGHQEWFCGLFSQHPKGVKDGGRARIQIRGSRTASKSQTHNPALRRQGRCRLVSRPGVFFGVVLPLASDGERAGVWLLLRHRLCLRKFDRRDRGWISLGQESSAAVSSTARNTSATLDTTLRSDHLLMPNGAFPGLPARSRAKVDAQVPAGSHTVR